MQKSRTPRQASLPEQSRLPLPSPPGERGRFLRAFLAHPILLPGLRAGLAQPWPGPPLGARGNAGILLFVGQHFVVSLRGGRQARPPGPLLGGFGIKPFKPASPPLVAVANIPNPIAAAAALGRSIPAFTRRTAQGAATAPAAGHYAWRQRPPPPSGPLSCWCVHIGGVARGCQPRRPGRACSPATASFRHRTPQSFILPRYCALQSAQAPGMQSRDPAVLAGE